MKVIAVAGNNYDLISGHQSYVEENPWLNFNQKIDLYMSWTPAVTSLTQDHKTEKACFITFVEL